MIAQVLPHNLDIERYILGCLIIDKQDMIHKLTEDDFYDHKHQLIYKAINYLAGKKANIDLLSVSDILKNKIEDSFQHISGIVTEVPTTANVEYHLKELKTYSVRRQIIKRTFEIQEMAYNTEISEPIDLRSDALQKLNSIDIKENDTTKCDLCSIMVQVFDDIDKKYNAKDEQKLFTGFYDLDKITAGLHEEEMTIVAARPGVGKTAFALQLMINLARKGNHCLLISREMSTTQIGKRILANIAAVDGHKLRLCKSLTESDFEKMGGIADELQLPIEINDRISNIQEIRAYCRELHNKGNLEVLIVDYIGLVKTLKKCESRRLEIEDISRQMKEISMEFHIPVVVLSQLSREGAKCDEPELHHLRESGAIEQDADNVIFLHVPKDIDEQADLFDIKVIIGKQRNGPTGYVYLGYARKIFRLYSKTNRG